MNGDITVQKWICSEYIVRHVTLTKKSYRISWHIDGDLDLVAYYDEELFDSELEAIKVAIAGCEAGINKAQEVIHDRSKKLSVLNARLAEIGSTKN